MSALKVGLIAFGAACAVLAVVFAIVPAPEPSVFEPSVFEA